MSPHPVAFPMVQCPMRNSCGTKKIIPKANIITGFCLQVSPCLEASGAFRAAPDPLSGGAAKPTPPTPPLGLTLGNLGEGGIAAEPDVVDPSPGLGDGGEQSVPAFRPHRPFGAGRIRDQRRAALWTRGGWQMERCCDASVGQPR